MRLSAKGSTRVFGGSCRRFHRSGLAPGIVLALAVTAEPPAAMASLAASTVAPAAGAMVAPSCPAAVNDEAAARLAARRCRGPVERPGRPLWAACR